ncbi:unnamed protein product, partial [Amoebophrya sp. A25]
LAKDNCSLEGLRVSVKTRIGVDHADSYEFLEAFIDRLRPVCKRFILHARKCILKGLTPAQNRNIPPLNYERVFRICERFPDCEFLLNGGIKTLVDARRLAYGTKLSRELSSSASSSASPALSRGPEESRTYESTTATNGSCGRPQENATSSTSKVSEHG